MTDGAPSYGPSALLTPANGLTMARLLATPVFIYLIITRGATWLTAIVGAVVAFSDGLDGMVARRQGTTRSGAFLDPLADKVVVLACLFTLGFEHKLPWVPIIIIAIREVAMSVYRSVVGRRGISVPARRSAKLKTLVQDIAIAWVVLPPTASLKWLQWATIWFAAVLSAWTFAQYMVDGRRVQAVPR